MSLKHPADRGNGRGRFDRLAEASSNLSSSPVFFGVCVLVIGAWVAVNIGHASTHLRLVAADLMAAITLALVALVKNAEQRSERAVQEKLDLIAAALLEEVSGDDRTARDRLRESIGLHDEI
jgi:low affinity Fe/Cu permease